MTDLSDCDLYLVFYPQTHYDSILKNRKIPAITNRIGQKPSNGNRHPDSDLADNGRQQIGKYHPRSQ